METIENISMSMSRFKTFIINGHNLRTFRGLLKASKRLRNLTILIYTGWLTSVGRTSNGMPQFPSRFPTSESFGTAIEEPSMVEWFPSTPWARRSRELLSELTMSPRVSLKEPATSSVLYLAVSKGISNGSRNLSRHASLKPGLGAALFELRVLYQKRNSCEAFSSIFETHCLRSSNHEGAEMIRKLMSGEYRLYSRKRDPKTGRRRNLGTFKTRAAAEKHERRIQFFKRHG